MKFGIIVFPGSNCDTDCFDAINQFPGTEVEYVWHKETTLPPVDVVVIPGGFSYGDYLRCGAIAKFSPIMQDVARFAEAGGKVIGICNGFQILTECHLLPGTLIRNKNLKFICKTVNLKLLNEELDFTKLGEKDKLYKIPIAHMDGQFFIDEDGEKELFDNNQVIFQYADDNGMVDALSNPNGSKSNIAGISNKEGNVLGMMPHPERVCESILNGTDGKFIFQSLLAG